MQEEFEHLDVESTTQRTTCKISLLTKILSLHTRVPPAVPRIGKGLMKTQNFFAEELQEATRNGGNSGTLLSS